MSFQLRENACQMGSFDDAVRANIRKIFTDMNKKINIAPMMDWTNGIGIRQCNQPVTKSE